MFSKSRINEPGPAKGTEGDSQSSTSVPTPPTAGKPAAEAPAKPAAPKAKPPASVLSSDLTIVGNVKSSGDIQIEGTVEGDIRAHLLTVGEGATIRGECVADDVIVNGRIIGRVRGLKVRLTSTARVEGDIVHKTIAIESGAHFEGSVQRQDDPLSQAGSKGKMPPSRQAATAAAAEEG